MASGVEQLGALDDFLDAREKLDPKPRTNWVPVHESYSRKYWVVKLPRSETTPVKLIYENKNGIFDGDSKIDITTLEIWYDIQRLGNGDW